MQFVFLGYSKLQFEGSKYPLNTTVSDYGKEGLFEPLIQEQAMSFTFNDEKQRNVFITEVEAHEVSKEKELKGKEHKTIQNCSYPDSFDGPLPQHIPGVNILSVLNDSVKEVFPGFAYSPRKFHNGSIYFKQEFQHFLLDLFWWLFIKIFGDFYIKDKVFIKFEVKYRDVSSDINQILSKSSLSNCIESQDLKINKEKKEWIEKLLNDMKKDEEILFSRMAKNYVAIMHSILNLRGKNLHDRKTEKMLKYEISKHEKQLQMVLSLALNISFQKCFPDSKKVCFSDTFQQKLSHYLFYCLYGEHYKFLKRTHANNNDKEFMIQQNTEYSDNEFRPLDYIRKNNDLNTEEKLEFLVKQIERLESEPNFKGILTSKQLLEMHKQEAAQNYREWRAQRKKEAEQLVRAGKMQIAEFYSLFNSLDLEDEEDIDDKYLEEEDLENEFDRHKHMFNRHGYFMRAPDERFLYNTRTRIGMKNYKQELTQNAGTNLQKEGSRIDEIIKRSSKKNVKAIPKDVQISNCLKESPLITRYIQDMRDGSAKRKDIL